MYPPRPPLPGPDGASPANPRLTRRGLITLFSGLAVGGAAVADALGGDPVRDVAEAVRLPGPGRPAIYSCDAWHARDPSDRVTVVPNRPSKILIHHTATENRTNVAPVDLGVLARAIQNFHMDNDGWIDSGHQFLVNRGGLIAEGRHRSLETLLGGRSFIEGSQCSDYNDVSIGIENEGTYTEVDPPPGQLASLRALCAYACLQYRVDPKHLYGHRDFRDTACPGDRLYAMLPALRSQVAQILGKGADWRAAKVSTWPLLRIADRGVSVLAAQHLLRAAGVRGVPADGAFGRTTADGVFEFQRRHRMESTGMIGGGSWPLLAVPVKPGQGGEAEAAVQALLKRSGARQFRMPTQVDQATWQRLLSSA
ncbi:MAG TPA: N-acetylmuramoyl-L-alanine amidase [Pseudonocardia sp.]|nr:N-acetylmuramoyl-L-alanine amidase [Pseudonocardia sp.]